MKFVVVKVAAIGDIVMATQAIGEYFSKLDIKPEIHWIADENLISLGQALVRSYPSLNVRWYPIDSNKLFTGSIQNKVKEAFRIGRYIRTINPGAVCLLHRDWRYSFLIRSIYRGPLVRASKERLHEIDVLTIALNRVIQKISKTLTIKTLGVEPQKSELQTKNSAGTGILIGGAGSQKAYYNEKTYPYWADLIKLLLDKTDEPITLFGSIDDKTNLDQIFKNIELHPKFKTHIKNRVGKLKLQEIPAMIETLRTFISVDSGLAHIAATVMKHNYQRIITLFGPTDDYRWSPSTTANSKARVIILKSKLECLPCYKNDGVFKTCIYRTEQDFQKCMKLITPNDILKSVLF